MPQHIVNGIQLSYTEYGAGDPVLMIAGTGAPGRIWKTHQVPALVRAGFRVITMDSRGVPPSDLCEGGFELADMVRDTIELIKILDIGPCRIVGTSLGAIITQEILLEHPELIREAVVMATRGRNSILNSASAAAELELFDQGIKLPSRYHAVIRVTQGFSRRTLGDEQTVQDWLDLFDLSPISGSLSRSQIAIDIMPNRLGAYRGISTRCLVIAFTDDLLTPPYLCREVADALPNSAYLEIADCGHYGYLEEPGLVNSAIIDFFHRAV